MNLNLKFSPRIKINSKGVTDLKVKHETIIPKRNHEEKKEISRFMFISRTQLMQLNTLN